VAIVGAGFSGATLARCFAEAGRRVLVVDRRPHWGGNAADGWDAHGVWVHWYGPHLFHTNSPAVWRFLSRFTAWRPYQHRVRVRLGTRLLPFPINRTTLTLLYGEAALRDGVAAFFATRRAPIARPANAAEQVLARVGPELYQWFFAPYTAKQWGRDPTQLAPSVTARIPVREDADDRYFTDRYQALPAAGYHALFRRLLDHPEITVWLGVSWEAVADLVRFRRLIYTGPLDAFFGHCYGPLPYRSLRWHWGFAPVARVQPVATVNWPAHPRWTRITEFKHLTGQRHHGTTWVAEEPVAEGEPYYPIPAPDTAARLAAYQREAARLQTVRFFGRLGRYRYYNMDQVVAEALAGFRALRRAGW